MGSCLAFLANRLHLNDDLLLLLRYINGFLNSYNNLFEQAKEIVASLKTKNLTSKTYNAETEKLLDDLNLCKSGFNSLFEDTWHTLMGIEMQLFERTEVISEEEVMEARMLISILFYRKGTRPSKTLSRK